MIPYGNHMIGGEADEVEEKEVHLNPHAAHCYVCGYPYDTRAGCLECARRERERVKNLIRFETPNLDKLIQWAQDVFE